VWFGTATRREKGSGAANNCLAAYSVHVDADCKTAEGAGRFKAAINAFPLPPSIVVATGSPHSFHVYWRLAEPLLLANDNNDSLYTGTVAGLARHLLTDPSVSDLPRVMRLPGSRNPKAEAGGALVRMTLLKPDRMYHIEDFAIYADPGDTQPAPQTARSFARHSSDVDLVAEFTDRGWLIEDRGDAFYYVRCPWAGEHTASSGPSETALWAYERGFCFKCMHSHCAKRRVAEVYEYFRLVRAATMLEVR
jgi:hypothetical protein